MIQSMLMFTVKSFSRLVLFMKHLDMSNHLDTCNLGLRCEPLVFSYIPCIFMKACCLIAHQIMGKTFRLF